MVREAEVDIDISTPGILLGVQTDLESLKFLFPVFSRNVVQLLNGTYTNI